MRIEDAVDRCMLVGFEEVDPPDWLLRVASRVGGIVFYGCNLPADGDVARLADALLAESDVLLALDEEGGDVTRLHYRSGSPDPGNHVLGAADDLELTTEVASGIGARLRAAGIGFNLAPDADVNANLDNPVIGVRAFGSDPAVVSGHTSAWITAMQAAGVAACAKHFPGHGDTMDDSHLAMPVVQCDERQWRETHLPPFVEAVGAGVRAVMTAHITVPALDRAPATVSRRIITGLLREELGFDGVVVTDALDMGAVTRGYGSEAGAVTALAAGADLLCLGVLDARARYERVRAAVIEAVRRGDLPGARVIEAAERVDQLRSWVRRARSQGSDAVAARPGVVAGQAGLTAARLAAVVHDVRPLAAPAVVVELRCAPNLAVGDAGWSLAGQLAACGHQPALVVRISERDGDHLASVLGSAGDAPLVVVGRDVARHPWQRAALDRARAARRDTILVDLGLPRPEVLGGGPFVLVCGAAIPNLRVAAEVLTGHLGVS